MDPQTTPQAGTPTTPLPPVAAPAPAPASDAPITKADLEAAVSKAATEAATAAVAAYKATIPASLGPANPDTTEEAATLDNMAPIALIAQGLKESGK
jgi:hypothetical protein